MEHLHWSYLEVGLLVVFYWGLMIWWIRRSKRKQELAKPLTEKEFYKFLERRVTSDPTAHRAFIACRVVCNAVRGL